MIAEVNGQKQLGWLWIRAPGHARHVDPGAASSIFVAGHNTDRSASGERF